MEATIAGLRGDRALRAYRAMAPVHDAISDRHDCEAWLADLLENLEGGLASADVAAASVCESRLEVERRNDGEFRPADVSVHCQRPFPEAEVLAALGWADLEGLGVLGHGLDGIPQQPLDTSIRTKAIYIGRRQ